jgi:hypothetical protein
MSSDSASFIFHRVRWLVDGARTAVRDHPNPRTASEQSIALDPRQLKPAPVVERLTGGSPDQHQVALDIVARRNHGGSRGNGTLPGTAQSTWSDARQDSEAHLGLQRASGGGHP